MRGSEVCQFAGQSVALTIVKFVRYFAIFLVFMHQMEVFVNPGHQVNSLVGH